MPINCINGVRALILGKPGSEHHMGQSMVSGGRWLDVVVQDMEKTGVRALQKIKNLSPDALNLKKILKIFEKTVKKGLILADKTTRFMKHAMFCQQLIKPDHSECVLMIVFY